MGDECRKKFHSNNNHRSVIQQVARVSKMNNTVSYIIDDIMSDRSTNSHWPKVTLLLYELPEPWTSSASNIIHYFLAVDRGLLCFCCSMYWFASIDIKSTAFIYLGGCDFWRIGPFCSDTKQFRLWVYYSTILQATLRASAFLLWISTGSTIRHVKNFKGGVTNYKICITK